ncbi:condensation domain-containing protein [Streptomyces sp. NBC_01304]|uniref:condensation domain-containing protein n=1 Tax=Streptomyces sp. NBC_01304 TaxID=2903818 RepID=UPI002E0E1B54|nr:condensation domain-containing protein [Streptomyces sp. NBC_01304]
MTTDRSSYVPRGAPLTVVVDPGSPSHGTVPALELCGTLDVAGLEAAVEEVTAHRPHGPVWRYQLHRHGPRHHTLTLTAVSTVPAGAPDDFPVGLLADLLTAGPTAKWSTDDARYGPPDAQDGAPVTSAPPPGPVSGFVTPSPLQCELLAASDAQPGAGRHIEQLTFDWHGPLDPERFVAAWQSVFDHESVLRAAFDDAPDARIVLHERVTPEVVRLPYIADVWDALVESDRSRGVDPRRPGPLRVTVLSGEASPPHASPDGTERPHRVLLTYHQALLDGFSVRLLVQEFFRAYLADGRLPGGHRRPDLGDYSDWLAAQDLTPAREFWTRAARSAGAASLPGPVGGSGRRGGPGRARLRLTPEETDRLSAWAGTWGATESSALQAVWALLLYRGTGADGTAPVTFSVTVSGRGIPLKSVERMPGALRNPLPLSVDIDPDATVPRLLTVLRDDVLALSAYEWVSAGQIRAWTDRPAAEIGVVRAGDGQPDDGQRGDGQRGEGRPGKGQRGEGQPGDGQAGEGQSAPGSLLVFQSNLQPAVAPPAELAAHGIRVSTPTTLDADTAFPLTLVAHRDSTDGLVLALSHDLAWLPEASEVLADVGRLLRRLPYDADEFMTIRQLLGALASPAPARPEPLLRTLRVAAHADAGTVCLIAAPELPDSRYEQLARSYPGPEAVVLLSSVPATAADRHAVLPALIGNGERLVLGGFSGGGAAAYEFARRLVAEGAAPPLVVLTNAATPVDDLARALEAAAERAG